MNIMSIANSMFGKKEEPKQELKIGDNTNFGIITDIKEYSVCFGKNKIGVDIWYKKSDVKLEPKQETLQKSLDSNKQFIKNKSDSELNDLMGEFDNYEVEESTFTSIENELIKKDKKVWEESHPNPIEMALFGAKWQAERMYSEEEVHKILGSYSANKEVFSHKYTYNKWFEQFKKK